VVSAAVAHDEKFMVIVNTNNPAKTVSRKFLASVFLKKITFWDDGEPVLPVDFVDPEVRSTFSSEVLKKPVTAVRSYWQQMIFSGQAVQPLELDSEQEIVKYVSSHSNAIAYVSGGAVLSSQVKTISWK
jgi:ABC-type phosphate transport system substrate-binding protein